ncbi:tight adherence protein B [Microbacterium sp. 1154]|uniref:pilus assembly protein TadB n=1 Tax=Microbacterium sp. 1154 TaxID=2817733 RepID=UPI0028658B8E|nr:pilus assembly protein TadB [Microbacterium sp. 1154]MDR6691585.1 tight adherence protein B [Microbacterium sp. 1154]
MNVRTAGRSARHPREGTGSADPIETVLRLAVLLSGGTAPTLAWRYLAESGDPTLCAAADAAEQGRDVGPVLQEAGDAWGGLAAIWSVAVAAGAPLSDALRSVVGAMRETAEVTADVRVALAEPAATARLLGWLPLVGVPLGGLLGFDPIGTLLGDPLGQGCLVLGLILMTTAYIWMRRLSRTAQPPPTIPGLEAELWAVALSAGVSVDRARRVVDGLGIDRTGRADVLRTLELATRAGVPAAELLRGNAWIARYRARTDGRVAAAKLSTRLLVPLGVCTLPAFLLIAVVPAALAVLRSTALP